MKQERIAEVGYINEAMEHAMISIYDPAILNAGGTWVQVVISIDGATRLRDELDRFIADHATGTLQ
jgi:hypothetical protein